jgi:glycosyltransferase involved in cell wall biosynthesis
MRVLHVQRAKGIGGSERHLLSLLPALAERGVEPAMCVLECENGYRFVDALRRSGIDVTARAAGGDFNLALVPFLVREIRRLRPDVVHTHLIHADLVGQLAAKIAGIKGVSSVHGTPAFYRREPYRSVGRLTGVLAARRIAISRHVGEFLGDLHLAPPERIRIVHYGIDSRELTRDPLERLNARHALGAMDGEVVVGIAARLIPGKGHALLIEAHARATEAGVPVTLFIAGDGPLRKELEAFANRICPPGTVRFLGFQDDISPFLAACDMLVFPTLPELGEGFGLAALEAMAAGRPVVASAVASLPEVVADGETGLLVPPGSISELQHAVVRLARDAALRRQLGARGVERARTDFSLEAMASRHIAVYEELA